MPVLCAFLMVLVIAASAMGAPPKPAYLKRPVPRASLCFLQNGQPRGVPYDPANFFGENLKNVSAKERTTLLVSALIKGPDKNLAEKGYGTGFPADCRLADVQLSKNNAGVRVYLDLPVDILTSPAKLESARRAMLDQSFNTLDVSINEIVFYARDPETDKFKSLEEFLPKSTPIPPKPYEAKASEAQDFGVRCTRDGRQYPHVSPHKQGFLSSKHVYVNPGHGWTYHDNGFWYLQRGIVTDCWIMEDHSNTEAIHYYLYRYLRNAGAQVWSVRESDPNTNMVIVDNSDGTAHPAIGTYIESGSWVNSSLKGFAGNFVNGTTSWVSGINPMEEGGNRLCECSATETGRATWTPNIPEAGFYNVYVSYSAYSYRAEDAHYVVKHPGGETHFRVDQTHNGLTWVYLGNFFFDAGTNPDKGSVVLINDSQNLPANVSADAVRFGGGVGLISRGTIGTSGKLRFEEEARYNIQFQGCPESYYDYSGRSDESDGWTARGKYAAWQNETGQQACFISHHTNAGGGTGTSTFLYTNNPGTDGEEYRALIHDEIINDIRHSYDASWYDRGKKFGYYGECNPNNVNNEMPIVLVEWLFHDNPYDSELYRDPKFRRLGERAMYQGIVKYFAWKDGVDAKLLPEPPYGLTARNSGPGQVTLTWHASPTDASGVVGDPATSYRVYKSTHGYAFDNGTDVAGLTHTFSGLTVGQVYYFRVTGVNEGGESFPTETLAVRISPTGASNVLIVHGFSKFDELLMVRTTIGGKRCDRGMLEKMNLLNYVIHHAKALDTYGAAFDSTNKMEVANGGVDLSHYKHIIWMAGQQCEYEDFDPTDDHSFLSGERTAIENFITAGGNLFVTGSEIGWDLDRSASSASEKSFYENKLRAHYLEDYMGTKSATGSGGIFASIGTLTFGSGSDFTYTPRTPDKVEARNGSSVIMTYTEGGAAAVQWSDANSKLVYIGFPFETIDSQSNRNAIMAAVCDFFDVGDGTSGEPTPTPTPSGPTPTPTATPTPSPTPPPFTLLENFEEYDAGTQVMFRQPHWSGSTRGINRETDTAAVSTDEANDTLPDWLAPIGTKSYRLFWEWETPGAGFVRDTTHSVARKGNPLLDLHQGLSFFIKVKEGDVDLGYWIRETGGEGPIGADGGTSGGIEKMENYRRLSASPDWQYIFFGIPNETYTGLEGHGNGILDGDWGTLEALILTAVAGTTSPNVEIFIDDMYQGGEILPPTQTPTPTPTTTPSPIPTPTPTSTPTVTPTPTPVPVGDGWMLH